MISLRAYLDDWASAQGDRAALAATLNALAEGAAELAGLIAEGPLAGDLGEVVGDSRDGDGQKLLDRRADALFLERLRAAPVRAALSEEQAEPVALQPGAPLVVALDPLDGSNNIAINAPLGTIFSVLPAGEEGADPAAAFLTQGERQLAAGFVLFGPHTVLVLTVREGVQTFVLDRARGEFHLTQRDIRIPEHRREYAINSSNNRFWPLPVRAYVEECVAGREGPRGADYNTRWLGALVGEAYRILLRGGIYLYPSDTRPAYRRGRLRLLYEANPIALLVEQAGGAAIDGYHRILELVPESVHQNVPLIFGSQAKVERVAHLHAAGVPQAGQRPLFAARGLFRS
ncbi:class 1 fructose-bisphosphatase [Roseicella frigidaeris]|uniref:Fructose-1,6-bisphosphatase class 1 n=1 Tax=Roseicella frigidaeris TaxID=2230885 RepID=A0A327M4E4_9PROT|nr:class 1 fructose-bisphosphatase [Roseicella frigidaeris]RAI57376.1 class 1 fructose-bisphosphatase [Roseicella frigidaeris]